MQNHSNFISSLKKEIENISQKEFIDRQNIEKLLTKIRSEIEIDINDILEENDDLPF